MATATAGKIERAHQMYREGQHEAALELYTEALTMAKTKAQKIALHSNRAACYLKFHDFRKAADECTSVLELDNQHSGALMLRAQTLVTLKEYQSALFDVNRLMELNPASDVYRNLQARLRTQLALAPIPESEEEALYLEEEEAVEVMEAGDRKVVIQDKFITTSVTKTKGNEVVPAASVIKENEVKLVANNESQGWKSIRKPKGHSGLDYSRWDRVDGDSSEDDDDDDQEPQYCFRVRTVSVRPVK